jgi:hypothetical protein
MRVSADKEFSKWAFFSCIADRADISMSMSRSWSTRTAFSRSSAAHLSSAQCFVERHSANSASSSLRRALHASVHSPRDDCATTCRSYNYINN